MRYWVYINDKVEGPFTEDKLVTLEGFTPDTLICSEDAANSGNQEWVKASSIFEFDQVAEAAQETASANADESSSHHDEVPTVLLSRLDSLNKQLADLQSKLDNIQFKLDESISTQQKSSSEAAARDAALAAQVNTLFVPQPNRNIPAAPQVLPPSQPQKTDSAAAEKTATIHASAAKPLPEEETLSSSISLDLDNDGDLTDSELTDQKENDVVLNAALTSMQDQHIVQDEQENTFQDLLTPEQAKDLAEEAAAKKQQAQQTEVKSSSEDDAQKQAVLAQFSAPNSNEEVIDQIIQEKKEEEEQFQEKDKRSISQRIAAGAAALAATFASLKGKQKKEEELVVNKPLAPTENSQSESTQPTTSTEPATPADIPDVEPLEQQIPDQPTQQEVTNTQPQAPEPLQPMEAEQPINEVLPSETQPNQSLPSLEDNLTSGQEIQNEKESTLQELVPGAENDKTEGIITEEDLKEVFVDRAPQEDASIDQLLGTAPTVEPAAPQAVPEPDLNMPSLSSVSSDKPAETAMPEGNPNDLTEIELKEGSTYLISDFVPPASSKELEAAYAKKMQGNQPGAPNPAAKHETKENKADDTQEIQEMVAAAPKPEQPKQPTEAATAEKPAPQNNTPTDVTVSSIVLENTIKPKRGAALDIKTVPMVPEPANSDRIQLEGMDDGINTQHDMQSADIKPAGKTTKMVVGVLIMLLLGGAIYAILGFMNLIPAQYNLLSSQQQVEAQPNAQLDEMLGTEEEQPVQELSEQEQPSMQEEFPPVEPQQEVTTDPKEVVRTEVQNYLLSNGQTLKSYVESKHPAMVDVITWDVKDSASADNYTVWIKVPPENPQSFKSKYV